MPPLTDSQRDLLDHIDYAAGCGWQVFADMQALFRHGFAEVHMERWGQCFFAAVYPTPQGIAVLRGLN